MDFLALAEHAGEYPQALCGKGEFQVAGERYTSEDGVHYLQRDVKFPCNKQIEGGKLIAVYCPSREMVSLLVREGCEERTLLRLWRETWPEETLFAVSYAGSFDVPMRDGVALSTDVYLPADVEGKVPAVLARTPMGKRRAVKSTIAMCSGAMPWSSRTCGAATKAAGSGSPTTTRWRMGTTP